MCKLPLWSSALVTIMPAANAAGSTVWVTTELTLTWALAVAVISNGAPTTMNATATWLNNRRCDRTVVWPNMTRDDFRLDNNRAIVKALLQESSSRRIGEHFDFLDGPRAKWVECPIKILNQAFG